MKKPPVQYTKTRDGAHVAYQIVGDAPVDVMFLPHVYATIDAIWEHPGHLRWWRYHASFCRIIVHDSRGFGSSDPVPQDRVGDLGDWVEDTRAVMDAVGVDRAVILGEATRALVAVAFAVAYPERTRALVLVNGYASDSPRDETTIETVAAAFEKRWGTGDFVLATPTLSDPAFREWAARFERNAASPSVAAAFSRRQDDVRHLLPRVACPTLVVYTGDLPYVTPGQCKELAERIPGARLLELPPSKSFYLMEPEPGNEYETFITGAAPKAVGRREVVTLLFTDIVGSTPELAKVGDKRWREVLDDLDTFVDDVVARRAGRVVDHTGDGHLATFSSPSAAVEAAKEIRAGARVYGVETRIGLHTGEVEIRDNGNVSGLSVHVAARVMGLAGPGELLVSRTVADLAAGAGFEVADRGAHELRGVPGAWQLYEVIA